MSTPTNNDNYLSDNINLLERPTENDNIAAINYQKAAENGDASAMNNLAVCYKNGEGIEKNLEKAFYWYQKAAENGNEIAINNLAICYEDGVGTEKNLEKAFYWYKKAAENDNKDAQSNLALNYKNGIGTEQDLEKAFYWYQKAAENDSDAMLMLAMCYYDGEGTEQDLEKAFYWYQKAAKNGNKRATSNLAICYKNGFGTEQDFEKAFYWFQKAAEMDYIDAQFNLAKCYEDGVGTEYNLEKAFYWFQKAAENDNEAAMNNLAVFYSNGKGTEQDLEKAFYWYQKAAENGDVLAMATLAICYEDGEGTEKNLEKAFYWYQKAAENDDKDAMYNLSVCYKLGEGVEQDLEKAFYWSQKAAENNFEAMMMLAMCYFDGEGTEKNLEEAFYWFQKAAENGHKDAMISLAICYENGEGTEKNLEKTFYWYQKAKENNINSDDDELCEGCNQPYIDYYWCQQCNSKQFEQDFSKWTSENEFVDRFIQEAQLNAKNCYEVLEWIPYDKLEDINYHDKGGFSEIHKATWLDGPIDRWNFDEQQWDRREFQEGYEVILKNLNNSSGLNDLFLNEWKYHYNCIKKSFSKFIQFFGITQNPNNSDYMIVMSYAKKGSLRKCLSDIVKFKWQHKLQLLKNIVSGLKVIHESDLAHGDFHDGNILISDNYETYIIDLGLCKPINDLQDSVNRNYGVLPFMAPELLRNKPYTLASDIYSFSMIMWEFTSGIPPFSNVAHDYDLVLNICDGERPEIAKNTPKCYIDLMKKCWDSDPFKRPTIMMLENIISQWLRYINIYYEINDERNEEDTEDDINMDDYQIKNNMYEFIEANKAPTQEQDIVQFHSQVCYTSRLLTEIFSQRDSQGFDCMIED